MPVPTQAELQEIRERLGWSMAASALQRCVEDHLFHRYAVVEPETVPYVRSVVAAVEHFSRDLGIAEPELMFFVPEAEFRRGSYGPSLDTFAYETDIAGLCVRGLGLERPRIFVHAALRDGWDAIAVTLHELRHAAQPIDLRGEPAEVDADEYAYEKAGRYPFNRNRRNL